MLKNHFLNSFIGIVIRSASKILSVLQVIYFSSVLWSRDHGLETRVHSSSFCPGLGLGLGLETWKRSWQQHCFSSVGSSKFFDDFLSYKRTHKGKNITSCDRGNEEHKVNIPILPISQYISSMFISSGPWGLYLGHFKKFIYNTIQYNTGVYICSMTSDTFCWCFYLSEHF